MRLRWDTQGNVQTEGYVGFCLLNTEPVTCSADISLPKRFPWNPMHVCGAGRHTPHAVQVPSVKSTGRCVSRSMLKHWREKTKVYFTAKMLTRVHWDIHRDISMVIKHNSTNRAKIWRKYVRKSDIMERLLW